MFHSYMDGKRVLVGGVLVTMKQFKHRYNCCIIHNDETRVCELAYCKEINFGIKKGRGELYSTEEAAGNNSESSNKQTKVIEILYIGHGRLSSWVYSALAIICFHGYCTIAC